MFSIPVFGLLPVRFKQPENRKFRFRFGSPTTLVIISSIFQGEVEPKVSKIGSLTWSLDPQPVSKVLRLGLCTVVRRYTKGHSAPTPMTLQKGNHFLCLDISLFQNLNKDLTQN